MKKAYFILFIAIILTVATRFYRLGAVPAGLYLDEAAQGYNAYSILLTGKDEFGKAFPAAFRSFADFKTPVYIYLIAPLIPLFGLSAFTVRFPSFLASLLTIPILFLLIRKLVPDKKLGLGLASLSVLLLSISPWHILFGRTNFECNVALLFFLSGIYLFYLGLKKPLFIIPSAIVLAIALPSYHSERLLVPLTVIFFAVRFRSYLFKKHILRFTLTGIILAVLISLPTLAIINTPGFLARVNTLSLRVDSLPGFIKNYSNPLGLLVNNPFYLRGHDFLSLYLSYFSPRNLFFLGDYGPRSSFPELSTFYIWMLPLYFHGFYMLFKRKDLGELKNLTIFLLVVSPLPAALTRDPFSTIRALPLVVPITILISLSLVEIISRLKTKLARAAAATLVTLLIIYSLAKLGSSVIILNEYFRAPYWDYGWQQVVEVIATKTDPDLPIIIDNVRAEPYSQILFYTKYDPASYQKNNFEVPLEEYYTNLTRVREKNIGRIKLRGISWEQDLKIQQYFIGDFLAISEEQIARHNLELIKEIKYPDGSPAYRFVKTRP